MGGDTLSSEAEPLCRLELNMDADTLAEARAEVRAVAQRCGADRAVTDAVVQAVSEALQNVIRHAYRGAVPGRVDLSAWFGDGTLWIAIRDYAPPVDLASIKPRPLDQIRPGGLGTHFINTIMDHVTYQHAQSGQGNIVTMGMHIV